MLKKWFFLFLATAFVAGVQAQTADEVINKYLEVTGGADKWKALKSVKMEGSMSMQGFEFPGTIYSAPPNRLRVEVNIQGQQIVQAFDGSTAWWINPLMGSTDAQKAPAEMAEAFTSQDFEFPFIDYKTKGHSLEMVGESKIEGTDVYELKLTKKDGKVQHYFFDKENGVIIMIKTSILTGPAKGQFTESYLSDYQEVEGLMMPFFTEEKVGGQTAQKMTIKSIKLNPSIEEAFFKMPVKK